MVQSFIPNSTTSMAHAPHLPPISKMAGDPPSLGSQSRKYQPTSGSAHPRSSNSGPFQSPFPPSSSNHHRQQPMNVYSRPASIDYSTNQSSPAASLRQEYYYRNSSDQNPQYNVNNGGMANTTAQQPQQGLSQPSQPQNQQGQRFNVHAWYDQAVLLPAESTLLQVIPGRNLWNSCTVSGKPILDISLLTSLCRSISSRLSCIDRFNGLDAIHNLTATAVSRCYPNQIFFD